MDEEGGAPNIEYFLQELPKHYDDPDWLSKCAVKLSTLLYNLGDEMASAKARESSSIIKHRESIDVENGKKMSVSEAEKRATVDTDDEYERYKLQYEAIVETIQSIKKRLDYLTQMVKLVR